MSDLSDLISALHPDLADYVVPSGPIGPMLHHPLIIELFLFPETIPLVNKQYEAKKNASELAFEDREYRQYLLYHERPYRLSALEDVIDEGISSKEYWHLVAWVFSDCENVFQNQDAWIDLWSADVSDREAAMDPVEAAVFQGLPDVVTVFRGVTHPDAERGLSWTLSKTKARWFARRHAQADSVKVVIEGTAPKSAIWSYQNGRGEQEVVLDPDQVQIVKRETID